jgi:hypothetical protein
VSEQVKTEVPELPDNHPARLKWKDWMPGRIAMAMPWGHISGCMLKGFKPETRQTLRADGAEVYEAVSAAQVANEWFAANPGLLVLSLIPHGDEILCVINKTLSPEEVDENNEISRWWDWKRNELKQEREERDRKARESIEAAAKEAAEKAEAEAKETKRLAELGRRHEKNCKKKGE